MTIFFIFLFLLIIEICLKKYLIKKNILKEMLNFNKIWFDNFKLKKFNNYENTYPYLPYTVKSNVQNQTNSKGYVGKEFSWEKSINTFRIACIGGSTTYHGIYPINLEFFLNNYLYKGPNHSKIYEILNFGAEFWTTAECCVNFIMKGSYCNLDCVIIYEAINDVFSSMHPKNITPQPDYSHYRKKMEYPQKNFFNLIPLFFDKITMISALRYYYYKKITYNLWSKCITNYPSIIDKDYQFMGTSSYKNNIENIIKICIMDKIKVILITQIHNKKYSQEKYGNFLIEKVDLMNEECRNLYKKYKDTNLVFLVDAYNEDKNLKLSNDMYDLCHFTNDGYLKLAHYIFMKIINIVK